MTLTVLSRRNFLIGGAALMAAAALPRFLMAAGPSIHVMREASYRRGDMIE